MWNLLPHGFLSWEGNELLELSHFGLTIIRSPNLYILSSFEFLYLFPFPTPRGSFSDHDWARHRSMSIVNVVMDLVFDTFLLQNFFFFPLGPWPIQCQVPEHPSNVRNGFHLTEQALNSIREWLATLTMFVLLYYCILPEATSVHQQVYSWVSVYCSPLIACRVSSRILYTSQQVWRL